MKRVLLAGAFFLAASTSTFAAPDYGDDCEKIRGTITCVDPVGNSENSGGQSQEVVTTSQGNLKNKQECSGPGNSASGC